MNFPPPIKEDTSPPCSESTSIPLYDPSPDIVERNPLSVDEIADKLDIEKSELAAETDSNVEVRKREDGSVQIVYRGKEDRFRVGYTTHDKAKSGDQNPFEKVGAKYQASIPGRYSVQVKRLENGEYEYTVDMHKNLSGAVLEVGDKKFVVSSTGEVQNQMTTLREELLRMRDRLNEISASDRFPLGVTSSDVVPLVEYLRLSEMKRDTRGPGLSSADEARLQFLGKNYKALIERLDIPFDPQNQSNYR